MQSPDWQTTLQLKTEQFLTWRKRRKLIHKEKQRRKNPILDWTEVILSAALIVLLINQYLFQAYQIPSESMLDTLKISDRIFVDKLVYGPELVPGQMKMPGLREPRRGEVIIFESPTYISKGPWFDIVHRVLYMLTFTLLDIDRDADGNVAVHFLIKRAIGMPGDRLRVRKGEVEFLLPGETNWIPEAELKTRLGKTYRTKRLFPDIAYESLDQMAVGVARLDAGLQAGMDLKAAEAGLGGLRFQDKYHSGMMWSQARYRISPHDQRYGREWLRRDLGWYMGEDSLFPMGDNRDNSNDARYFNPVRISKVLGRANIRFWPLPRLGVVR